MFPKKERNNKNNICHKFPKGLGCKSHRPRVNIGTDHAGFALKEKLVPFIKNLGYEVVDFGAFKYEKEDDYPDYISSVAKTVALNPEHNIGIILGGSGQGEAIVANRFPNVRATVYYGDIGTFSKINPTRYYREHNDSNILSLGARFLTEKSAKNAVKIWLGTPFSNGERHKRRIKKIERVSREIRCNTDFK